MINQYIKAINNLYSTGVTTEHSFRGDLQHLLNSLLPEFAVINEPKRRSCGAPDYIVEKKQIPIFFVEAKDIGENDLHGKKKTGNKEQFDRYKQSLNTIIFTDYLNFLFYKNNELIAEIAIAKQTGQKIAAIPENFTPFINLIKDFSQTITATIKNPKQLAQMMASKARMLADVIAMALIFDEQNNHNSSLYGQMDAFKKVLIHDITPKQFADIYAQTIAYGMFAARLNDEALNDFTRQKAATLIPKSNPFLRTLFQYISGYDLDERIEWIVNDLADIFRATDVAQLLKNFGKATQTLDPFIHFYEDFLAEYDPNLRKQRGVWYTPEPVVQFIVRAVDDILQSEFSLPMGLASNDKTTIEINTQSKDARTKSGLKVINKEIHKVQILDPATGTGTFLTEVVRHIYKTRFATMKGMWHSYVEHDLIPRLNGFELLMASYAVAHLKLELLLKETGYVSDKNQRLKIYLTNSLEEHHPETGSLFAGFLANEANEANHIKRDSPVMVVIGNPPYSGESANKGDWIMQLMNDYKKEPNSDKRLNERNPKAINDDYVKFMRYGQHFIEKNGEGILAFINPHGFLDNPTFRGMRWHLLNAYDKIYIIDLHGNAKKKETAPDGSKDENVFDIMQGVSINIFVKTGKKQQGELAQVFHYDLFGLRDDKYAFLNNHSLKSVPFTLLENKAPSYFMVQKDFANENLYNNGFLVTDLFELKNVGIVTSRDNFVIDKNKHKLAERIKDFFNFDAITLKAKYDLNENKRWYVNEVQKQAKSFDEKNIKQYCYRPFDIQFIYYEVNMIDRIRYDVMKHFIEYENIGLVFKRGNSELNSVSAMVTTTLIDFRSWSRAGMQGGDYIAPLYLYPETTNQNNFLPEQLIQLRKPNLNPDIVTQIANKLNLTFIPDHETKQAKNSFNPLNLLDYIYAVLHSPTYRNTYKEFLKIDFPRIPYPKDKTTFWQLVQLGEKLRKLHLLQSPDLTELTKLNTPIISYHGDGDNIITRKMTKTSIGFELVNNNNKNNNLGKFG
ncbi:adenine-specific DNA methyltransferase [Moraxella macacae 0408225]|uniref:site-specific DNA-methyltransferase (adenine-specific) n=1 Tax=Moraxella macacae 0408225 TaxID=1230338 RepID=L2F7Y7_9GAMM|nr:type ISP restriction/modification enzyme [Moraxella macacae]ELA09142.1 adenine-specific DNA methyltransferase [Moraxella macacae 0408225]